MSTRTYECPYCNREFQITHKTEYTIIIDTAAEFLSHVNTCKPGNPTSQSEKQALNDIKWAAFEISKEYRG